MNEGVALYMDVAAPGVVLGTDLVYDRYAGDPALLGVARFQGSVILNGSGLAVPDCAEDPGAVQSTSAADLCGARL